MTKSRIPSTGGQTQRGPRVSEQGASLLLHVSRRVAAPQNVLQGTSFQRVSQQRASFPSGSPQNVTLPSVSHHGPFCRCFRLNAMYEDDSPLRDSDSPPRVSLPSVSQHGPFRRCLPLNATCEDDLPLSGSDSPPTLSPRGATRRGTSRLGRRRCAPRPTPRQRLESKAHVKTLNKEYKFAVDCLKTLLRGFAPQWCSITSAPLPDRSRDKLCTENIKKAILHLVGNELAGEIDSISEDWFFENEGTMKHMRLRALLEMLTTEYCNTPCTTRKFLEFCCKVAEFSARTYIMGDSFGPPYGVLCIFYAIMHSMVNNPIGEDFDPWAELDDLAERVNEQYSHISNPMLEVTKHRRQVLLMYDIEYRGSYS